MIISSYHGKIALVVATTVSRRPRVLLVVRSIVLNPKGEILVMQRAPGDRWNATKWEFPGGKLEEGRDVAHAVEDEVFEEAGIMIQPVTHLAYVESIIIGSGKYKGLPYVVITGIGKSRKTEVVLSQEHSDYKWIEPAETVRLDLTPEARKALVVLTDNLLEARSKG